MIINRTLRHTPSGTLAMEKEPFGTAGEDLISPWQAFIALKCIPLHLQTGCHPSQFICVIAYQYLFSVPLFFLNKINYIQMEAMGKTFPSFLISEAGG